jgi:hypothetical protein
MHTHTYWEHLLSLALFSEQASCNLCCSCSVFFRSIFNCRFRSFTKWSPFLPAITFSTSLSFTSCLNFEITFSCSCFSASTAPNFSLTS